MRHLYSCVCATILATAVQASAPLGVPATMAEIGLVAVSLQQDVRVVDVLMTDYAFTPMEIVVAPGMVRLRMMNAGLRRPNIVALVGGVEQTSPTILPGELVEWEVVVDSPGRYMLWCNEYRHLEKGMTGTLVVE